MNLEEKTKEVIKTMNMLTEYRKNQKKYSDYNRINRMLDRVEKRYTEYLTKQEK